MKLVLLILSTIFIATFAQAAVAGTKFVYVTKKGVTYTPDAGSLQPTVRIVDLQWGYDLTRGRDEEVCIVEVEPLRGADAPITPEAGSFLIFEDRQYLLPAVYEENTICSAVGM